LRTYLTDDVERTRRAIREVERIYDFTSLLADENGNLANDKLSAGLEKMIDSMIELRCDIEEAYFDIKFGKGE